MLCYSITTGIVFFAERRKTHFHLARYLALSCFSMQSLEQMILRMYGFVILCTHLPITGFVVFYIIQGQTNCAVKIIMVGNRIWLKYHLRIDREYPDFQGGLGMLQKR
ncbi:hypothetical protein ACJX0J_010908, partial [Zea mays]